MDYTLFLQHLRDLPIEDGRAYIREHIEDLSDHHAAGEAMAEEALRILYTPFPSLKIAELLIFYGELTGHLHSHALGLKAKGNALVQISHHQAAMDVLDTAGDEFLQLGDEKSWARTRISWVLACGWLGRIEEALKVANVVHEMFLRLDEPYWACVIDSNVAIILANVGKNEEAIKLYERILSIYPTVTNQSEAFIQRSIAIAQKNQAASLFWLGKFEEAYLLQQKALASFNMFGLTSLAIPTEINLAELEYTQGYYGSALRHYYQARERLMQGNADDILRLAMLKAYMANCLVKLNRMQEACLVSEEAVEAYRKIGLSQSIGNALHRHASTLAAAGKLKEALAFLDEAWDLFKNGGFEPFAFLARLQQAEILLEMGSATAAYDQANEVKYYFDAQNLLALAVRASLVMVEALIEEAQKALSEKRKQPNDILARAIDLCKETISRARQQNLQEEVYKSHYLMGKIFALQKNFSKTARYYQIAITQIERILDNLVYDLTPSFLHTTWTVYEDMIALCLEQGQNERAFSYLERVRSLALRQELHKVKSSFNEAGRQEESLSLEALRTQMDLKDWQEKYHKYSTLLSEFDVSVSSALDKAVIEQQLKQAEEKVSELFERLHLHQIDADREGPSSRNREKTEERLLNAQEIDPGQLRQHLSPEQTLLAYYLHKDSLVIFALTAGSMVMHIHSEGGQEVEHLSHLLLHGHLEPGGWPNPHQPPKQTIRRLLNKLYKHLIAPVESFLPPQSGHLTIVPYGLLHTLPFHALYDGSQFLIERFQVSYLPASSLISHLGSVKGKLGDSSPHKAGAMKLPLVFGYSENGHLQRVQDEAKAIASLLHGRCYLERDATIANLIQQAPATPIIHLATHGQKRLDAPNFSYVRLADGHFNSIDAFSLDLAECELVTLSGCETGLALTSGADEQLGLGRAFLTAGAASLLMSLWPVEDSATCELMKRFYQHLLSGESKAQALRAAQCEMVQQEGSMYTHPYFWAAFRLVGDIGPLRWFTL